MKNLNTLSRRSTKLLAFIGMLLILFSPKATDAQTAQTVNITVNIIPPYSPFYADYSGINAGKVLLILQNLTANPKTIKLTGQLTGDNGIRITTKSNYVPLQPIVLNPNETKQLNGLALKDIFDLNSLNVYGIDKSRLIYTSRIPEGNYTFCVQAVDMATNQVISANAPLGCTPITITYPDAPVPISPGQDNTVSVTNPQSVIFNWINAGFAPVGTQYILQVAEMPLTVADPNQILNATSFPLINKDVRGFSYVLSPSDPPLKIGRRYAWRVKAVDPSGQIIFKNNGLSQAFQFRYGAVQNVASIFTIETPKDNQKIEDLNKLIFKWQFKNNSSINDPVVLGLASIGSRAYYSESLFKVYIKRKPIDDGKFLQRINSANSKVVPKDEIVVDVYANSLDYTKSKQVSDFLEDQTNYEWHVEHPASQTKSAIQNFVVKKPKVPVDYTIQLAGQIKYRYFKDMEAFNLKSMQKKSNSALTYTQAESGYPLANTNIQALRMRIVVPIIQVKHTLKIKENGIEKTYSEMVDSIPTLSDLLTLHNNNQIKVSSVIPIASGVTNATGNFTLTVPISKSNFKIIDNNVYTNGSPIRRAMVEGVVVQVNNQQYSDPNWFIFPTENQKNVLLEEQVVQIYDYKLKVDFNESVQRNFKGKLYLLKSEKDLIRGEVSNVVGETKEIKIISKSKFSPANKQLYDYSHKSYSVVGVNKIESNSKNNAVEKGFDKLVSNLHGSTKYTLYFEPSDEQDAMYFTPEVVSNGNVKTAGFESTVFKNKFATESVILGPKYLSMKISGRYLYKWKDPNYKNNDPLPLPEGTILNLVKGYLTSKSLVEDRGSDLLEQRKIATTTVGKNGEYSFNLGLLNYSDFNKEAGKNMVILVDNPYYTSEPTFVGYKDEADIKMSDLTSIVRQFKFTSRVMFRKNGILTPAKFINVYLCRTKGVKPDLIPVNEGDPDRKAYFKTVYQNVDGKQYDILDKTTLGENGMFSFKRLALPSKVLSDAYFILAEPTSDSQENYLTEEAFPLTGVLRFWSIFTLGSFGQQEFSDATQVMDSKYAQNENQYVLAVAQNPYIDGAVYPYSNTATSVLSGVKVDLFNMSKSQISPGASAEEFEKYLSGKTAIESQFTGSNGRFLFSKFYDNWGDQMFGKVLRLTKSGFLTTYKVVQGGIPILKGQRANLGKVYLDLPINLNAVVVDKAGNGVDARIIVGDDFSWADTYKIGSGVMAFLKSPKGKVKFTIIPKDLAQYKSTVMEVDIDPKKTTNITLVANSNTHNVNVLVLNKYTNQSVPANIYVTNIKEKPSINKIDAGGGYIINSLEFASAGNQFDIKAIPVGNFTIGKVQVKSDVTKTETIVILVEPATTVRCFASALYGNKKIALNDYNINIDGLDEDEYVFTKRTAATGALITRLPLAKLLTISATQKGFIGQEKTVYPSNTSVLNFELTDGTKTPITNLYGFPVELTALSKEAHGGYKVSGRLNPNGKAGISTLTLANSNNWLRFKDVKVSIGQAVALKGKFLANTPEVNVLSDVVFEENELDAKIYDKINLLIKDQSGLRIKPSGKKGAIVGLVALDPASLSAGVLSDQATKTGDDNYLYLNALGTKYLGIGQVAFTSTVSALKTFSTDETDLSANSFLLSSLHRRRPSFTIVDEFKVETNGDVLLSKDGLIAPATVKTNLTDVSTQNAVLTGTFNVGFDNIWFTDKQPLNIKLNQWQLEFKDWYLSKAGFTGAGNLNALGLTIPFTQLKMTPKNIGFGNFNVKQLTLLNKFPVTINASEVMTSFGFDKGYSKEKGAWSVAVLANSQSESLAALSGLPDLDASDKILINNINLYDTGDPADTRILLTENQPAVTLNKISSFKPFSVFGDLLSITIRGNLDLNIPNLTGLGNVVYDLNYRVINNQFVHDHNTPFKNLMLDVKGVKVAFSEKNQVFTNGSLKLAGELKDKDPTSSYAIDVLLDKDKNATSVYIPQTGGTPQKIFLSGNKADNSYLDNATGQMVLNQDVWSNFSFSGNLAGSDGLKPEDSKVNFIIKGDIVANDSKIGVQNMDAAGMKGINFTYDFKDKALVGSASFAQKTDFADLTMDIDMRVGGKNWYIFSNCVANEIKNTPFNQAAAGIMLGNANLSGNQLASLHKHFKDNDIPTNFDANFKSVKGILLVMSADLPIPIIPTFDLDLDPVAHATLTHGIYANMYYNLGFSLKKEDLSLAIGARLGAFLKLGVGASVGLACAGINLHADVHADASGKLAPFAVPGKRLLLDAGLKFTLEGSAFVGAGICNSSCETPCIDAGLFEVCSPIPCFKKQLSKKLVLGLSAEVTDASPYFHFKGLSEL